MSDNILVCRGTNGHQTCDKQSECQKRMDYRGYVEILGVKTNDKLSKDFSYIQVKDCINNNHQSFGALNGVGNT